VSTNYSQHFNTRQTPQTTKADPRQVQNSAGGFTFQITPWERLDRWLILGAEGGTYYATEKKLVRENALTIQECLKLDGARTVAAIVDVSTRGRAPKNDAAIFALAIAAADPRPETRKAALLAVPAVCRTATHLFQFAEAVQAMRGWGPALRRAIANWYDAKTPEQLCYQVCKYGQRNGWSHRDLLRLSHPAQRDDRAAIYRWITAGTEGLGERELKKSGRKYAGVGELPPYLEGFELLKTCTPAETIELIQLFGFTHEMINTVHKNDAKVWEALLQNMPMTAMIRNLGKMSAVGLVKGMSEASKLVCKKLDDKEQLRKARVHPIQLLSALRVYQQGHGEKGKLTWTPAAKVIDALDSAFYDAFETIEPSGKNILLGIDVSGSMGGGDVGGCPGLTPRQAAAVMAMATARVEQNWEIMGFGHTFVKLPITPKMRLDTVMQTMAKVPFGSTDCSLPMQFADKEKLKVDVFHVYTDNETYHGHIHPHQALQQYRAHSGVNAKLAVVAFSATEFSIADRNDAGMMDFVGFDSAAPNLLADFARGGAH
jgi:60 kDa SS-A/Ro ribonucleoprotein